MKQGKPKPEKLLPLSKDFVCNDLLSYGVYATLMAGKDPVALIDELLVYCYKLRLSEHNLRNSLSSRGGEQDPLPV